MLDQIIIGDKASYDDFHASVALREIGMPPKKIIKATVPFSNVTYDFTDMNGEIYWKERELEYVFEIIADTPELLEEYKTAFAGWIANVLKENIHDPFIPDYHFVGTFSDMSFEDDEGLDKTTVKVSFTAYPYKIANNETVFRIELGAHKTGTLTFTNNSAHKVAATLITDGDVVANFGNSNAAYDGTYTLEKIDVGSTSIWINNLEDSVTTVSVCFYEEVF